MSNDSGIFEDVLNGPNVVDPAVPSAVGSRNSLYRGERDEYYESQLVVDEEVDKILNHIGSKLPPETLEKLDVMANIKSKLHNYYNQSFQNMFNRYITTVEDELSKKFRDLVDVEERRNLNRYTPRSIVDLLNEVAGPEKFNTSEIEKSIINVFGHLHGAIQRGVNEIEQLTNTLLRKKTDVGAFLRGENAYAIIRAAFKPNANKPNTVMDAQMAINILDSEIISPVLHVDTKVADIVKKLLSNHIIRFIDSEIEKLDMALMDENKEQLTDNEKIFEKLKSLDKYFDASDAGKISDLVSPQIFESLGDIKSVISPEEYDALGLRENIKRIVDSTGLKNRGYNTLVNTITQILDSSRMGYEHIENYKNMCRCEIREYYDTSDLPDEQYSIRIEYIELDYINELRKAYDLQYDEIEKEIHKIEALIERAYLKFHKDNNILLYQDIVDEYLLKGDKPEDSTEDSSSESDQGNLQSKVWNEFIFVQPEESDVENANKTNDSRRRELLLRIKRLRELIHVRYSQKEAIEKSVALERVKSIEEKMINYVNRVNPYHINPGILLTINLTTVTRKQITLKGISNVLNEFLNHVSKGFRDSAFATFSRRRSTDKKDIDQIFETVVIPDEIQEEVFERSEDKITI